MEISVQDKYDCYGKLVTEPWPNIKKGDTVRYKEASHIKKGNRIIRTVNDLVGIWDGEKVQFDDNEKTLIRTTRWLKRIRRQ